MRETLLKKCRSIVFWIFAVSIAWAADEITVTTLLRVSNGDYDQTKNVSQFMADQSGRSMTAQIQSIGTGSWEQITIGADVSSNGYAFFRNITTNTDRFIDLATVFRHTSTTGFVALARLQASTPMVLNLHPTNAIFARAFGTNDAVITGVNLEYWVNEE